MRRPDARLTTLATSCFLVGCMGIQARAIPDPSARYDQEVHGVVLADDAQGGGRRVETSRVEDVTWTDSTIVITGVFRDDGSGGDRIETREFPFDSLSGILVRGLDVNRTSAIIALVVVGTVATVAFVINGGGGQGPLR